MGLVRWSSTSHLLAGSTIAGAQYVMPPVAQSATPPTQIQTHTHAGPRGGLPTSAQRPMTIWRAGPVTCNAEAVASSRAPNPLPALSGGAANDISLTLTFRIDASGRPLSIRRPDRRYVAGANDLMPSLAAATFAAGRARDGCSITFDAVRLPFEQVPVGLAMAYTLFPTSGGPPEELWRRVRPPNSTCQEPPPALLNRAFPDFTSIQSKRGRPTWSMVGCNIDPAGKPINAHTVAGSRSPALDAAAIRAVASSRFAKGARQGCLYPYWKIADPLPAPELPAREVASADACKQLGQWVRAPRLIYPDDYRHRGVEGWAIVSYDVAPWGALGNIKVIGSEPTSAFGEAAMSMFLGLARTSSDTGASGCVDRVRYVMGKPGMPPLDDQNVQSLY